MKKVAVLGFGFMGMTHTLNILKKAVINELTKKEKAQGWQLLFDGKSFSDIR